MKLKPCPDCGGNVGLIESFSDRDPEEPDEYIVMCSKCYAMWSFLGSSRDETIFRWNGRVNDEKG